MRSIALDYTARELGERDLPEPAITGPRDVLFKIKEIGICGTDRDLSSFKLAFPPPKEGFLVLGHECVGEVLQAGSAAFTPGDIVVPLVRRPCAPPCPWCAPDCLGPDRLGNDRRDLCATGHYTERGISGEHGYFTELAVDTESNLVRIPAALAEHAVLIEPLSVVEKAIETAFRLHPGQPESALILGAGTIGLLAAMTLAQTPVSVTVSSLEPAGSQRARLVEQTGAAYRTKPEGQFDLVIEAAGAPQAAASGLSALGAGGVLVILGASVNLEISTLQMIVRNQIVVGSVNAAPAHFRSAVNRLSRFPAAVLRSMIAREPASSYRSTLTGPLRPTPKIVHVISE